MKLKAFITLPLLTPFLFIAQNPNSLDTAWVNSYGGPGVDIGRGLKETSDKGFIIAGTTTSFGSGNTSIYLIKTDSMGKHEWSKTIGTSENDLAYSIEIASDSGYFISGFSNWKQESSYDGYLVRTDKYGTVLWTKNYGGNDWDFIYNSCAMPDGGLMLCGKTHSDAKGGSDAYLIRLNVLGDTLWTRKISTSGDDALYSIKQKNNRIYTVGQVYDTSSHTTRACLYKFDFNGVLLQQNIFAGTGTENTVYYDVCLAADGNILACGKRDSAGGTDHYVLRKLDSTSFSPLAYITTTQDFYYRRVIEGNTNDVYTLGHKIGEAGGQAAQFLRFSSGLNFIHGVDFGGPKDEEGYDMIYTSKGFYALVGSTKTYGTQTNNNPNEDVYLVIFNKKDLQSDYLFVMLNEFQDNLSLVGIKSFKDEGQQPLVFPNPSNGAFQIRFSNKELEGETVNYTLFDQLGRSVIEEVYTVTDNRITAHLEDIKPGIYTYKLSCNYRDVFYGKISVE